MSGGFWPDSLIEWLFATFLAIGIVGLVFIAHMLATTCKP